MTVSSRTTKAQLESALQETRTANWQAEQTIGLLEERFADLELAMEDTGWVRLATQAQREFSRDGLRKIILMSTMAYLKNPLIRHGTDVQAHYVWGQGVTIHCPDDATNQVIQSFLKDRKNRKVLTGHQARHDKEIELQTKSNIFIVLFTDPASGRVQVRTIPVEEVQDIIRNPDDNAEPWYYVRKYDRLSFNQKSGLIETEKGVVEYYPDWLYAPSTTPSSFGDAKVMWEMPIYHVAVGRLGDMRFGIPEHYSALDWAMAVKNDLEDYATIRRALARFAFKLTTSEGPKAVSRAKAKLGTTLGTGSAAAMDRNPPPVAGSTWIQPGGVNLEPFKTAGSAPNPEEGRRLWLMVSSGTGIPETILTGDSSVGNYATSRTLDRPTELKMLTRQQLWTDVYKDILTYVVNKSQKSVTGELSTLPQTVEAAIREASAIVAGGSAIVNLGAGQDAEKGMEAEDLDISVDFPAILEHDMLPRVQAIVQAATLNGQVTAGTMSDRTLIRLLLKALNVENADALIDEILPEGSEYFDTDNEPVAEPNPFLSPSDGPPGLPIKEAQINVDPSKKPPVKPPVKPGDPATPPEDGEENPNVDPVSGVGMTEDGLHKIAPPPPSMRNQKGKSANPFDSTTPPPQMDPTGTFTSDKNSQRVKGSTPPRKGP